MRGKRIAWFLGMIVAGIAFGLVFGWIIHPIQSTRPASLETLRMDYKTDYVLMAAEIYHADHNLEQARQRLALLSSAPPASSAADALKTAQNLRYASADLDQINALVSALQGAASPTATPTPGVQP